MTQHHEEHTIKLGPFTIWQWAVLAVLLVAIGLNIRSCSIADQAHKNTERIDKSICAEIHYLERIATASENPQAADELNRLTRELRETTPSCPPFDPDR